MANTDSGLPGGERSVMSSRDIHGGPDIDRQPTQPEWAVGNASTPAIDEQPTQHDLAPVQSGVADRAGQSTYVPDSQTPPTEPGKEPDEVPIITRSSRPVIA